MKTKKEMVEEGIAYFRSNGQEGFTYRNVSVYVQQRYGVEVDRSYISTLMRLERGRREKV